MNERDQVLGNEETQNVQLELDALTPSNASVESTPVNEPTLETNGEAPAEDAAPAAPFDPVLNAANETVSEPNEEAKPEEPVSNEETPNEADSDAEGELNEKAKKKEEKAAKKAAKKAEKEAKKAEKAAKKAEKAAKKAAKKAKKVEDDEEGEEDNEQEAEDVENTEVEEPQAEEAQEKPVKVKKPFNEFALFAWIAALIPVLCAVLPVATLLTPKFTQINNVSLLDGFFGAAASVGRLLNLNLFATAPVILTRSLLGFLYGGFLLVLPVVILLSVVFAILASAKSEKAGKYARMISVMNFAYYFCVSVLFTFIRMYTSKGRDIDGDWGSFIPTVVMLFLTIYFVVEDLKGKAVSPIATFVFSSAIAAFYLGGSVFASTAATKAMMNGSFFTELCMLAVFGFSAVVFFFSLIRLIFTKDKLVDVIFSGVAALGSLVILGGAFVSETLRVELFATATILAFVCALFQLLVNVKALKNQPMVEEVQEVSQESVVVDETNEAQETVPAIVEDAIVTEENSEVNAEVQEQTEAFDPNEAKIGHHENAFGVLHEGPFDPTMPNGGVQPPQGQPAYNQFGQPAYNQYGQPAYNQYGQPAYNQYGQPSGLNFGSSYMRNRQGMMGGMGSNAMPTGAPAQTVSAYDWFLESLTIEERQEFVNLFVYKNLGGTATLPNYVAGGDNYAFFRYFFLNLGKYRDRISANLLDKMYKFMTNMY